MMVIKLNFSIDKSVRQKGKEFPSLVLFGIELEFFKTRKFCVELLLQ